MERPVSVWTFLQVTWQDWGSRMSGIFSVPFGALAAFSDSTSRRLIWGALALLAILATIYKAWAKEREKVIAIQNDLESEKEKNTPILNPTIEQTGGGLLGSRYGFCINLRIANTGAPSREGI